MKLLSIVAASENNVIGKGNEMPWHLPDDLKYFKKVTSGSPVIMGKNTWISVGSKALPNRLNIVISRSLKQEEVSNASVFSELSAAIAWLNANWNLTTENEIFVMGGGQLYEATMDMVSAVYLTRVHTEIEEGTVFFPKLDPTKWTLFSSVYHPADEKHIFAFTFEHWIRK